MDAANETEVENLIHSEWVESLVASGQLTKLDRKTLSQTVKDIRIFEDQHIEITYLFSEELRILLEQ